ncbi:protein roadkill-like isoform 1-T3 [Glossina fuscipes fuscipes]
MSLPVASTFVDGDCARTKIKVDKFIFTWTVENFSIWCKDMRDSGEDLVSPIFSSDADNKLKWHLQLKIVDEKKLSLYLIFSHSSKASEVKAKFNFHILSAKKEAENVREATEVYLFNAKQRAFGFHCFIYTDDLLNRADNLLPNDELTIVCEIGEVNAVNISDESKKVKSKLIEDELSKNLGNLFVNEKCSDVALVVGENELKAHKLILSARSEVFAAMFEHEMEESKLNRVVITDIHQEVLKEMLNFIYTGKVFNLNKLAQGLLAAADKYALEGLKMMCEGALSVNLSAENAVEILILADLHSAAQLKAQTIVFIKTHITDVMGTQAWQDMIKSHSHLIVEVSEAFLKQ